MKTGTMTPLFSLFFLKYSLIPLMRGLHKVTSLLLLRWNHKNMLFHCEKQKKESCQKNFSVYCLGTPQQIMGVVQLVVRKDNGELLALADYRKGGVAAGYR